VVVSRFSPLPEAGEFLLPLHLRKLGKVRAWYHSNYAERLSARKKARLVPSSVVGQLGTNPVSWNGASLRWGCVVSIHRLIQLEQH